MNNQIQLTSPDNHSFDAYEARPEGTPRGGLIILQEIFGVNEYIRWVADFYAQQGFHCVAPAVMDRVERGIDLPIEQAAHGREIMNSIDTDLVLRDIGTTHHYLQASGDVAVIGFCWGGLLAYLAASQLELKCAIAYYGGRIFEHLDKLPRCPMQFHFAEDDHFIPLSAVEQIKTALPDQEFYIYQAGHGFDSHTRPSYVKEASDLARERSRAFLDQHFGNG